MNITTERTTINTVPVQKWGLPTGRTILAVHGLMSHKADTAIQLLAEKAVPRGYHIVSIDLPEHGDRNDNARLNPWTCVDELQNIFNILAKTAEITLFGCSIGAYMSLLALADKKVSCGLFLSPVVDMRFLIEGMMSAFDVNSQQLETQKHIDLPNGQFLDWEYYSYVCTHPIRWKAPAEILWGYSDNLMPEAVVDQFCIQNHAHVTKVQSEHYFHTPEQLTLYTDWLDKQL